jgi:hypothetical protein
MTQRGLYLPPFGGERWKTDLQKLQDVSLSPLIADFFNTIGHGENLAASISRPHGPDRTSLVFSGRPGSRQKRAPGG